MRIKFEKVSHTAHLRLLHGTTLRITLRNVLDCCKYLAKHLDGKGCWLKSFTCIPGNMKSMNEFSQIIKWLFQYHLYTRHENISNISMFFIDVVSRPSLLHCEDLSLPFPVLPCLSFLCLWRPFLFASSTLLPFDQV